MAKKWISALVALEANFLLAGKGLVIKKKKKKIQEFKKAKPLVTKKPEKQEQK